MKKICLSLCLMGLALSSFAQNEFGALFTGRHTLGLNFTWLVGLRLGASYNYRAFQGIKGNPLDFTVEADWPLSGFSAKRMNMAAGIFTSLNKPGSNFQFNTGVYVDAGLGLDCAGQDIQISSGLRLSPGYLFNNGFTAIQLFLPLIECLHDLDEMENNHSSTSFSLGNHFDLGLTLDYQAKTLLHFSGYGQYHISSVFQEEDEDRCNPEDGFEIRINPNICL